YYGQFGRSDGALSPGQIGPQVNPANFNPNGKDSFGFAFAVAVGIPTAKTLVDSGTQITSNGDASVTSSASSTTNNVPRLTQHIGSLSSVESSLGADGLTQQRNQVAAAVGVSDLTSTTTVSHYSNINATGNVAITSTGANKDKNSVSSASYFDGQVGVNLAGN